MINLKKYTNKFSTDFKSGDLLYIYLIRVIRKKLFSFKKKAKRIFSSRRLRGRRRDWLNVSVKRGYKFWRWVLIFGRILFINASGSGVTVGLQIKKKNQFVLGTFFLNATNVVGIRAAGRDVLSMSCRKNLSFLVTQRKEREKRVWPLRRMCRINHKVK